MRSVAVRPVANVYVSNHSKFAAVYLSEPFDRLRLHQRFCLNNNWTRPSRAAVVDDNPSYFGHVFEGENAGVC